MATEKRNTSKLRKAVSKEPPRELLPNQQLKRYADEAYGDTDVPARQRSNSQTMDEKKQSRRAFTRAALAIGALRILVPPRPGLQRTAE